MTMPLPGKLTVKALRRLIAKGEHEQLEFKGRGAATEEIVSAVVCFANGTGGLCLWGVEKDGQISGVRYRNPPSLLNRIYRSTSPSQVVQIQTLPVTPGVEVVAVWTSHSPQIVSTTSGSYSQRLGLECVPMTPDRIVVRQIDTNALDASSALTPVPSDGLDPLEIQRFRGQLPEDGPGAALRALTDTELLRAIGAVLTIDGTDRVTAAGLLVFGQTDAIRAVLPQHELVYLRTLAGTTEYERRLASSSPLLALIENVQREVQAWSRTRTLRLRGRDLELPDYPERAVREAIVNALAHRHLMLPGHVVIRQTAAFLEIENPGGFPEGIDAESVIQHAPVHRNRRLCEILDRVRYMERSGLGVDRIYEDQLRLGKVPPVYVADRTAVRLRLDASHFDDAFARFVLIEEQRGRTWRVEDLLVTSYLRRMGPADRTTLARVMQRSEEECQEFLNTSLRDLVERWGSGTASRYGLSSAAQALLGSAAAYTRERGLARESQRGIVIQHARQFGRVDNKTVRELLGLTVGEATQVLRALERRGDLLRYGSRRWAYYEPVATLWPSDVPS